MLKLDPSAKGEKTIELELRKIQDAAKTLKKRAETENMSEHMQERVDNAIEESENLEHFGTLQLDALSQKNHQDKLNMNQRPKLSYETFDGSYSAFGTFMKNAEQLFSFFPL